jgi:uncharacterized protein (TIGR02118 family)
VIHQFIFAAPKPGMTEQQFQDYWINTHAPQYASKIKQIKQYSVSVRLPLGAETADPLWSGLADIWLENDADQLASLWSKEMVEGAHVDEPRWASFWRSVVLDTDAHVLKAGGGLEGVKHCVKLVALVKRTWGTSVEEFRGRSLETQAPLDLHLPGLRRAVYGLARDGLYGLGEPPFDGVFNLWFDSPDAVRQALASPQHQDCIANLSTFLEMKYRHIFLMQEHWSIGPNGYD